MARCGSGCEPHLVHDSASADWWLGSTHHTHAHSLGSLRACHLALSGDNLGNDPSHIVNVTAAMGVSPGVVFCTNFTDFVYEASFVCDTVYNPVMAGAHTITVGRVVRGWGGRGSCVVARVRAVVQWFVSALYLPSTLLVSMALRLQVTTVAGSSDGLLAVNYVDEPFIRSVSPSVGSGARVLMGVGVVFYLCVGGRGCGWGCGWGCGFD